MSNTITPSTGNPGLNYTPVDGDEAICEEPAPVVEAKGNAQGGHIYENAQSSGGYEGAGSVEPEYRAPAPGGFQLSLEGQAGFGWGTVGVQGALVWDDECGFGVVASFEAGVQTPGAGGSVVLGATGYSGSFEEFNEALELSAGGGAALYGEARLLVDSETGEVLGGGVAGGVGTPGVGGAVTKSESAVFFPACPSVLNA